ncbi:hypothetical protein HanPSC8_Chr16g0698201 [Helianthus annuus]|nr:hypothetical protein HanPSC8_Chr16g0698201 [Helianthus annuus]
MTANALPCGFHAKQHINSSNFCRSMSCFLSTSHIKTCLSNPDVATYFPLSDQPKKHTGCVCSPLNVNSFSAVSLSYITTSFFKPETASVSPSGLQPSAVNVEKSEEVLGAIFLRLWIVVPDWSSQIITVPTESTDAKYSLFGSKAIPVMDPRCPFKTLAIEPSIVLISLIPSSSPPAASMVPCLLKDKARMGSVNRLILDSNSPPGNLYSLTDRSLDPEARQVELGLRANAVTPSL